jgi:hypothetical protein
MDVPPILPAAITPAFRNHVRKKPDSAVLHVLEAEPTLDT